VSRLRIKKHSFRYEQCLENAKFPTLRFSLRLVFLADIRFTAKSGATVGSSCQSRLCSSARRIHQTRAVLASAPFGSATLRGLTAPPCAQLSPTVKRMFLLACKGQVDPRRYTNLGANPSAFGAVAARRSIWHLERHATEATTKGAKVHEASRRSERNHRRPIRLLQGQMADGCRRPSRTNQYDRKDSASGDG
jgi:hypothetical protein